MLKHANFHIFKQSSRKVYVSCHPRLEPSTKKYLLQVMSSMDCSSPEEHRSDHPRWVFTALKRFLALMQIFSGPSVGRKPVQRSLLRCRALWISSFTMESTSVLAVESL